MGRPTTALASPLIALLDPTPDSRTSSRSVVAPALAFVVAILGFLPIANWIPGGFEDSGFALRLSEWLSGSAIAIGGGFVIALLSRRLPTSALPRARPTIWSRATASFERSPGRCAAVIAALAFGLYAVIARAVFAARPLLIDEIAQALQARIFLTGRVAAPSPALPEFFDTLHMVNAGGHVFSQFPPGGPAMLALGEAVGAMWLVGPAFGALSVLLWAIALRRTEARPGVALAATLVFAFAPFTAFMSGSHMNHVTVLAWILVGVVGMLVVVDDPSPRMGAALACGLGFGIAATIRPVDAFAFAVPAGAWLAVRAARAPDRRGVHLVALVASGIGVALPLLAMCWFNIRTTGHPFLSGYELLWGKGHNIGFHRNPWGNPHTPARGLELVNLYFIRLQQFLFETPLPSLVPAIVTLALTRRLRAFDRYLIASAALVVALYFAYWHDGFYLGPRFVYPLLPLLSLLTARALPLLRERLQGKGGSLDGGRLLAFRSAVCSVAVAIVVALVASLPLRVQQYAASFAMQRWDADRAARDAQMGDALILVRESWEALLVVRMRALGGTQPEAERFYRAIDACQLEHALGALERMPAGRRPSMTSALEPLLADSAQVERREISAGAFIRIRPGAPYDALCLTRAEETAGGVLPLAPFLLVRDPRLVVARDLHERDTLLLARYPDRPVFLLRPSGPTATAVPVFVPLSRDSIIRTARHAR